MNLENQTVSGVDQVSIIDSLEAPILKIMVEANNNTTIPNNTDLIIYVDKNDKNNPSNEKKQYVFNLSNTLKYLNNIADKFIFEIKPINNDISLECKVERYIESVDDSLNILETVQVEIIDCLPICLFEGLNYVYTNYDNASIEVIYTKDNDMNRMFLSNAIYYNHKIKNDGEFCLDDIYFKDAFTKTEDKLNLEVDNASILCLTSKNNKFSLDEDGNLIVNSVSTLNGNTVDFNSIYPIGSIYLSVNETNPTSLFGGVWEQIKDKFLLSAGDNYVAGSTGGEATHVLTTNEIPSHSHTWNQTSCTNPGNHTHIVGADKDGGAGTNRYTVHITSNNTASGQQYSPVSGAAGGHTHTTSGSNSNTGGSQSHNNMPPYITVYMWKRVS